MEDMPALKDLFRKEIVSIDMTEEQKAALGERLKEIGVNVSTAELDTAWRQSYEMTRKDTHQAMEGLVHNLNTMHSRGGNQVVFSSINYGTDTSAEGRMVMRELLSATVEGLGSGEVPVFPIQIFKVKDGVSYTDEDYDAAMADFEGAMAGKIKFKAPNFDVALKPVARLLPRSSPTFSF